MKANDVKIGAVYVCKVSGRLARVRITAERLNHRGRYYWLAVNLHTGRKVTVKSPARLHRWPSAEGASNAR